MAEGGGNPGDFDPCVCEYTPAEISTQRLIELLRQLTNYDCTDGACYAYNVQGGRDWAGILFVCFWLLMAAVLFFLRPKRSTQLGKDTGNQNGPNNEPPAPPALS